MMKKYRLLIVFLCINAVVFAQSSLFHKGDKVCFVGNSITSNGEFYHNIMLYYVTRFPNQPITFFNCGISGDVCSGVLKRMDDDILIHNPTHAVIKLGMNDVNRSLYTLYPTKNADTLDKREEAISKYKVKLDSIINIFLSRRIKVILQKPTDYDQTG
jgi:endoglucanase